MPFFAPILFGLSASLDALLLGISYGIRGIAIRLWQNLLVSFITLLGTCISIGIGTLLLPLMPAATAAIVGSSTLIILGLYYITKPLLHSLRSRFLAECPEYSYPDDAELNSCGEEPLCKDSHSNSPHTTYEHLREIILLGITLSLNNMGIGFGASIAGLSLLPTAISTLLFSIIFLYVGNRLGQSKLFRFAHQLADPISGALLITLGLLHFVL